MIEKYTLTMIKNMGFTDKLIKDLLPDPELRENPYYRNAPQMKLWKKEDVEVAMTSSTFIEAQDKHIKRKEAARKAVETKKEKTLQNIADIARTIKVERIDIDMLKRKTLASKQSWYDRQAEIRNNDYPCFANEANDETVKRWMVNYVRHKMTRYDGTMQELVGKTGKQDAYMYYYAETLNRIAETYPELKSECENQIDKKASIHEYMKKESTYR